MNADAPFLTLPDYLRPGLDLVFVGINPGAYSAKVGKYFASPRNRFWPAFNAAGLADLGRPLGPGDEAVLLDHGIGFTDVVKRASASASDLRPADFREWTPQLREKLLRHAPLLVCFNGLTGYKWYMQYAEGQKVEAKLGEQPSGIGTSRVFVAPNPSPANAAFPLQTIVGWYKKLGALRDSLKAQRDKVHGS